MLMADSVTETDHGFLIDPFGAAPGDASRIVGLRGGEAAGEPGYVFRTTPIMPVPGPTEFAIRFDDLRADAGVLSVDVTATPAEGDEAPVKIRTAVAPLAVLAAREGRITVAFEAQRNTLYAVAGYLHDTETAEARGVSVELQVTARAPRPAAIGAAIEATPLPRLASLDEPDFGSPVSQPMTRGQCRHPDYRAWARQLDLPGADQQTVWRQAFVLQVLHRYGVLQPGTRGLALAEVDEALLRQLRAAGCIVATDGDTAAHDFTWSSDLAVRPRDFVHAVWHGFERLVQGGIGVHVVWYGENAVSRADIERLALDLVSHGQQVAQLKFRTTGEAPGVLRGGMPYGFVYRRTRAL